MKETTALQILYTNETCPRHKTIIEIDTGKTIDTVCGTACKETCHHQDTKPTIYKHNTNYYGYYKCNR